MFESVFARMEGFGARPAVVSPKDTLIYCDLLRQVRGAASYFRKQGIIAGDVVGITIADEPSHFLVSLALLYLGARQVTLASHDPADSHAVLMERANVRHIVSSGTGVPGTIAWPAQEEPSLIDIPGPISGGMVYLKTSGTTGEFNIVPLSESDLALQAERHPEYATERLLRLASIEHNNSKRHRLYCAFMGGANVFRPLGELNVRSFCLEQGVTCLDISRMHASGLATQKEGPELRSVKLRTGGSAIPIDVRRLVETHVTPLLYVRYASTETGAIAMAKPGEHDDDESTGKPLQGVELEIVDSEGVKVPVGETGQIRIRAPGMATHYLDSPAQTATRFRDGWFWPGDMGRFRADGSLIVQGRRDDMMILNGLNIFPAEIERVLERHPAVSVAAALPIESVVHGQIPVAAVELRQGASASPDELQVYARRHLALRAPRRILIMRELPRNSQGKLMRRSLQAAFKPARPLA